MKRDDTEESVASVGHAQPLMERAAISARHPVVYGVMKNIYNSRFSGQSLHCKIGLKWGLDPISGLWLIYGQDGAVPSPAPKDTLMCTHMYTQLHTA